MSRAKKEPTDEEQAQEDADIEVVLGILKDYGVRLGDTIRFRAIGNTNGTWDTATVRGICKDLSLDCVDHGNRGLRAIRPGYRYDVEVKSYGPRRGIIWTPIKG